MRVTASSLAVAAGACLLLATMPALALDCKKASTPVEKAICGDQKLLAQDAELTKTFLALKAAKRGEEAALLTSNQRDWIEQREIDCRGDGTSPDAIVACIGGGMEQRRRFLAGEPEVGTGTGAPLWPSFRKAKGTEETSVNVSLAFAPATSTAEKRLNAAVTALLAKHDNGSKDLFIGRYVYGSPNLASLHFEGSWEGGAHPMPWRGDINFDVAKARPFAFADAFAPETLAPLIDDCRKQVAGEMASTDPAISAEREAVLKRILADLGRWSFGGTEAIVGFDHGEINDYTEGDLECRFPAARLNALTKPDFPKF